LLLTEKFAYKLRNTASFLDELSDEIKSKKDRRNAAFFDNNKKKIFSEKRARQGSKTYFV